MRVRGHWNTVLDVLYEDILSEQSWQQCLRFVAEKVRSPFVYLMRQNLEKGATEILYGYGTDEKDHLAYEERYSETSPMLKDAARKVAPGQLYTDDQYDDYETYKSSVVYRELFHPLGLDHLMQTHLVRNGWDATTLAFRRPHRYGFYNRRERLLLDRIIPDLRRALITANRYRSIVIENHIMRKAQTHRGFASIVLDRQGFVVWISDCARQLVDRHPNIRLSRNGTVILRNAGNDVDLREKLKGESVYSFSAVVSHAPPLFLVVNRCGQLTIDEIGNESGAYLIDLIEPQTGGPNEAVLKQLFGLTRWECDISARLYRGLTPREIALEMGNSYETVRSALRVIFQKTRTRRQSELVSLIGRLINLR